MRQGGALAGGAAAAAAGVVGPRAGMAPRTGMAPGAGGAREEDLAWVRDALYTPLEVRALHAARGAARQMSLVFFCEKRRVRLVWGEGRTNRTRRVRSPYCEKHLHLSLLIVVCFFLF